MRTDPHSPNQYRADGTVSNIPEFAKAFNCPVGSKVCSLTLLKVILLMVYTVEPAKGEAVYFMVVIMHLLAEIRIYRDGAIH